MTSPAPDRPMPQPRRVSLSWQELGIAAIMCATPCLLIPGFLWVQWRGAVLHPEMIGVWHPTISWALNNPLIARPFGVLIVGLTPLLLTSVWMALRFKWRFSSALGHGPRHRIFWRGYIVAIGALQLMAAAGMLLLIFYPSHAHSGPHLAGSYMLFIGHAVSIFMSGIYSRKLTRIGASDDPVLSATRERRRARGSLVVAGLSVLYLMMFFGPKLSEAFNFYAFSALAAGTEVVVLSAFLLYLLGFTPVVLKMYRLGRIRASEKP